MKKHLPYIKDGVYYKVEQDDNCFHRKTKSISIRYDVMEEVEAVEVQLKHRDVILRLSKEDLKKKSIVLTFNKELKYYCPVEMWGVIFGNKEWHRGIEWEKL